MAPESASLATCQSALQSAGYRDNAAGPHVGAGTPELCPHPLTPNRGWGHCVHNADPRTTRARVPAHL
jgi:hypothetical protein